MTLMIPVTQAAQILGVCKQTVYNLIGEGRIPAVKLRGSYRIHRELLERQLAAEAAAATIAGAGGVKEESTCRTKEVTRLTGGSATKRQMDATLDALLAPPKRQRQRP